MLEYIKRYFNCKRRKHIYLIYYDSSIGGCIYCKYKPTRQEEDDYYYGRK